MRFVGQVMDGMNGVQIYYIIGLFIFITLFFVMLIRTILMPKAKMIEYKNSIFENTTNSESIKQI